MRKYRFRAWDGKKMHYDVFPWKHDFVISTAWHRCEASTGPGPLGSGGDTAVMMVPAVRFTELMQFTGLCDVTGEPIYEGDIVKWANAPTLKLRWAIEWEGSGATFYASNPKGGGATLHGLAAQGGIGVIGNIYEHPSLLTAE